MSKRKSKEHTRPRDRYHATPIPGLVFHPTILLLNLIVRTADDNVKTDGKIPLETVDIVTSVIRHTYDFPDLDLPQGQGVVISFIGQFFHPDDYAEHHIAYMHRQGLLNALQGNLEPQILRTPDLRTSNVRDPGKLAGRRKRALAFWYKQRFLSSRPSSCFRACRAFQKGLAAERRRMGRTDEAVCGRGCRARHQDRDSHRRPTGTDVHFAAQETEAMIVLNFSHPLTPDHLAQVEALTGQAVARVIDTPVQFDHAQPFAAQVTALLNGLDLPSGDWQTLPILVNPPALNVIAVTLLAELHGRMGYFPAVLRLRPVAGSTPPRFEVAEIINLQAVRDAARERR